MGDVIVSSCHAFERMNTANELVEKTCEIRPGAQLGFERMESEPRTQAVKARIGLRSEKYFDWVLRETPRSWRLEIRVFDTKQGFRSQPRFFKVHGALLRQLHGLVRGHFSIQELPTALLKGPAASVGAFPDRELNALLTGTSPEEKRVFNESLRKTVQHFLEGLEAWPDLPCPFAHDRILDRWSTDLWQKDQDELKEAFVRFIRPFREKQQGAAFTGEAST